MILPIKIKNYCKKNTYGLTLIELLLVLFILAIMCIIVTPAFINSIRGKELQHAGRIIVQANKYTRSMAILRQKNERIIFDIKNNRITAAEDFNITLENSGIKQIYSNEQNFLNSHTNWEAIYFPNGRCIPYNIVITNRYGRCIKIIIDQLGSSTIEDENH